MTIAEYFEKKNEADAEWKEFCQMQSLAMDAKTAELKPKWDVINEYENTLIRLPGEYFFAYEFYTNCEENHRWTRDRFNLRWKNARFMVDDMDLDKFMVYGAGDTRYERTKIPASEIESFLKTGKVDMSTWEVPARSI